MESKFFQQGNYIYECKASPTKLGLYFNTSYLKTSINKLTQRWANGETPSGYRYVFPVNYLNEEAISLLTKLQSDYAGKVDVKYYDCDETQRLLENLKKISDFQSLVNYIEQVRRG